MGDISPLGDAEKWLGVTVVWTGRGRSTWRPGYFWGYEGNAFAFTGNVEEDLLSITSVHPMREDAVNEFLTRAKADWPVVHRLIAQDQLVEMEYEGRRFYMRRYWR